MSKEILVTGGLGYIGSHTCVDLIDNGYTPIIIDNLCNSDKSVLDCIKSITKKDDVCFYEGDIRDPILLDKIFKSHDIQSVMHFAGLKAVGESVDKPFDYYSNNIKGSLCLLEVMQNNNINSFIFSSSATVYGNHNHPPFTEDMPTGDVTNPYGRTKYMIEEILKDMANACDDLSVVILRYFNPVGAHSSGLIGESPRGIPNNLMPYISKVAASELEFLSVYGDDYETDDGTGVRDYIHVVDLAKGHIAALNMLCKKSGAHIYNLGTGKGHSVMEVLSAYEQACGHNIAYKIMPRRTGDVAKSYANSQKACDDLQWRATKDIFDSAKDSWAFVSGQKPSDN